MSTAEKQVRLPFITRPMQRSDESLVYATWLNSLEPSRDRSIARSVFYARHHALIERRLQEAMAHGTALVACAEDDPTQVFGWVVGVPGTLDYVFVKSLYRNFRIATSLLRSFGLYTAYTHNTPNWRDLRAAGLVPLTATYDPYAFFLPTQDN